MTVALSLLAEELSRSGYEVTLLDESIGTFENDTLLGFLITFTRTADLVANWAEDADRAISRYQFQLRSAGVKAWNAYLILAADEPALDDELPALTLIEEDLNATRKIARAGISSAHLARAALLSLLPLQSKPVLEQIDMGAEIVARSGDIHAPAVRAFLADADDSLILQMLGEAG